MRTYFLVAASMIVASVVSAQQPSLVIDSKPVLRQFGPGTRFTFICKPNLQMEEVWGTDIYTDTTPLCSAAVHAGVIEWARGGAITVDAVAGQRGYVGSSRNRITSLEWRSHDRSYVFVRGASGGAIDWGTSATKLPYTFATPLDLVCPRGDDAVLKSSAVYGTDIYSDTSPICVAAVHAGVIGIGGGRVRLASRGPQATFTASTRFGVTTRSYGEWEGSYSLSNTPTRTIPDSVARAATNPGDNPGTQPPAPPAPPAALPPSSLPVVPPAAPPSSALISNWKPSMDVKTIVADIKQVDDTIRAVLERMKQYGKEKSFAEIQEAQWWVGNTVADLSNYVSANINPPPTRPSFESVNEARWSVNDEVARLIWARGSKSIAIMANNGTDYRLIIEMRDESGNVIPARDMLFNAIAKWSMSPGSCASLDSRFSVGWDILITDVSCPTTVTAILSPPPRLLQKLAPLVMNTQLK